MNEKYFNAPIYSKKIQKNSIRLSNEKKRKTTSNTNNININNILYKNPNLDLNNQNLNKNSDRNTVQLSNRSTKDTKKVHHYKKNSEMIPNRDNIRGRYNFNGTNPNIEEKTNSSLRKHRHNLNLTNNSKNRNSSKDDYLDFSNFNDNIQIENAKKIINILLYYIQFIQLEFDKKIKKINQDKIEIIKKLEVENKLLIQENNKLKYYNINLLYTFKKYEEEEIKNRIKEMGIYNQLLNENIYLRKSIYNTSNINSSFLLKMQKEIEFNKENFTNENNKENNNNNELNKEEENNIEKNPFNAIKKDNNIPKVNHRRQKTHFKLGDIDKFNTSEKETDSNLSFSSISSISSTNTIVLNEKCDLLGETLREMTNYNKTLKRNNNSKKNIIDKENDKEEKKEAVNILNLSNKKQPQLYYRTPKEKQKIEFTK